MIAIKRTCLFFLLTYSSASLSQPFEFEPAQLEETLISGAEEFSPFLTPDGKQLFFSRMFHEDNTGGKLAGADIWVSQADGTGWSGPTNDLNSWNNKGNNAIIGFNDTGNVVYLLNSYDTRKGIAFSKKLNGEWTEPESLKLKGLHYDNFIGFFVSQDYQHILISMDGADSQGDQDLYVSNRTKDGNWSEPMNLGPTVNSEGFEMSPFLTADKKYLFFASNGHGGYGDADIFVCERLYDSWDVWSAPKNLGEAINSKAFDAYFTMAADHVYFSSNRYGGSGMADIYSSRLRKTQDVALPDSVARMLREAKQLLKQQGGRKETKFLISFDDGSSDISYTHKQTLIDHVERLADADRYEFVIAHIEADSSKDMKTLLKNRIKKLVTLLRSQGISELDIEVKIADNIRGDLGQGDLEIRSIMK